MEEIRKTRFWRLWHIEAYYFGLQKTLMTLGSLRPQEFWLIAQIVITICGKQTKVLKIKSAIKASSTEP